MNKFFGYYAKCETASDTIAVIFGKTQEKSFVQIITKTQSFCAFFEKSACRISKHKFGIKIGENTLDKNGMHLDIKAENFEIAGDMKFGKFAKIRGDCMGVLKFLPFMECRHMVISMRHEISGKIILNNKNFKFNSGVGYIEGDKGKSFPKKYLWAQSHLAQNIDVFASCAIIPYLGIKFKGTICIININGKEYRLATYRGARVKIFEAQKLVIKQRKYTLSIEAQTAENDAQPLFAPQCGKMTRTIRESIARTLRFRFTHKTEALFDITAPAAFEFSLND
jgi:hypothetical protein